MSFTLTGKQVMKGVRVVDPKGTSLKNTLGILYDMVAKGVLAEGTHFKLVTGKKQKYSFSDQAVTDLKVTFDAYVKRYTPNTRFNRLFLAGETITASNTFTKTKDTSTNAKIVKCLSLLVDAIGDLKKEVKALSSSNKEDLKAILDKVDKISLAPVIATDTKVRQTPSNNLRFAVNFNDNEVEALVAINQYLDYRGLKYATDMYRDVVPMMKLLKARWQGITGFPPRVESRYIRNENKNIDVYDDISGVNFSKLVSEVVEQILKENGVIIGDLTSSIGEISRNKEQS